MIQRNRLAILAILAATTLAGCGGDPNTPTTPSEATPPLLPLDLAATLVRTTPAEAGFDPPMLARAIAEADEVARVQSLVVVREGKLVSESYFKGNRADSLNDIRSATKSVVSMLVGIAIQQGFLPDVDQTLGSLLKPEAAVLSTTQASITVRHLLTMTGGFAWDESTATGYNDWILSADHITYLLTRQQASAPGSAFNYNSAAVHLLGVVIEEAAGMPLPAFANQFLFEPLGITRSSWEEVSGGRFNGGSGLDLLPVDMAKLGLLMLQDGQSGSQTVLPSGWAGVAGTPAFPWRASVGPLQALSYGRLWWTEDGGASSPRMYMAWGFGGQFIVVVPTFDLVVVATTQWRGIGDLLDEVENGLLDVIVSGVIGAVR